jgi:hypothetical protein
MSEYSTEMNQMNIAWRTAFVASMIFAGTSYADTLVSQATIVKVLSSRGQNDGAFVVWTQGGSGPCSAVDRWIAFPATAVANTDVHKREFALLFGAMMTGMKVDILSETGIDCTTAAYVIAAP